jgi:hypothetical protein
MFSLLLATKIAESETIAGIAIFPDRVDGRTADTVVLLDETTFGRK